MVGIEFASIQFTDEYIGPHLLESITKGLYVDPLHTIREYIQNEVESDPPATTIKVHIGSGEISIWGNGGGMNKQDILNNALKIGFSKKDPSKHFGFRGIGIWSGIAVCNMVLISTKRKGENKKYLVQINAKNIREEINEKTKKLTSVLSENTKIAEVPAPLEEYGTHVRLIEILEESKNYILSTEKVVDYISLTLPVDFNPEPCEKGGFLYYRRVTEHLKKNVPNYKTVKIFLDDKPIYRPPFIDDLDPPEFCLLKHGKNIVGFSWFCAHRYNKTIEEEKSRGLIYKKYGFTIGDRKVCQKWGGRDPRLLNWYVGEIHVIDPKILPNSERVDFESSREKDILISVLKGEIQDAIDEAARKKSHLINLDDRIKIVNKLPDKPIFTSISEKSEEVAKVVKLRKLLKRDKKHRHTRDFADERTKERLNGALERTEKLIQEYGELHPTEKVEETPEPKVETAFKPPEVRVSELPESPSFSDLLENLKLEPESKLILDGIEEVLDGFIEDPQSSTELKQKIAKKLKEILS